MAAMPPLPPPHSLSCPLLLGDGDDNRPGMRGGHQMVIDVQTGKPKSVIVGFLTCGGGWGETFGVGGGVNPKALYQW